MVTMGRTIRMQTGCGKLYVTINEDDQGLCEVFSTMGKAGGCTASQSEAISRLISLALRSGISADEVVNDLQGISCPMPSWQNGGQVLSCADAIGKAIQMYRQGRLGGDPQQSLPLEGISSESLPGKNVAGACPECGSLMEKVEGCAVCRMCGYTRC
jgi:ribonucleoside-diphosphate reductase alpha chain